jgi:hypothetical protein
MQTKEHKYLLLVFYEFCHQFFHIVFSEAVVCSIIITSNHSIEFVVLYGHVDAGDIGEEGFVDPLAVGV